MTSALWRESAACRDWVEVFDETFDSGGSRGIRAAFTLATSVCGSCPVREACLDDALITESGASRFGVRGGLSASQRAQLAHTA